MFRNWRCGILAALALGVITSLPQLYLCYERGAAWNGSYEYFDRDEFAYSAYINALVDGRPRRNDPFTGQDNSPYETLFSIQFVPAYSIAIPARVFGVSASTSFVFLIPIIATVSALILFTFLLELTENQFLAAAGAIAVLCFGALTTQIPLRPIWIPVAFPFLRRYLPAFPFPFFLGMVLFVWRALVRNSIIYALLAGLFLTVLIYSYFFLWTAAAAWLVVFFIIWIAVRRSERWRTLRIFGVIGLIGVTALVPYLWLIAHRSPLIDREQLLEYTHRPDLFRGPELYGIMIVIIGVLFAKKHLHLSDQGMLLVVSLGLAPILIFNQQVFTGRSLQPFHYEQFVTNYWVLMAAIIALGLRRKLPKRIPIYVAIASLFAGLIFAFDESTKGLKGSIEVDRGRGVAARLKGPSGVAFVSGSLTDTLGTSASMPVLWSQYLYAFSHETPNEGKNRFYKYLYYSGFTEIRLRQVLERRDYTFRKEIFGADRANPALRSTARRVADEDIAEALDEFTKFSASFSRQEASAPLLSYAIVLPTDDVSNLDKWYERDTGEAIEGYKVYRLKLRD